MDDLVVNWNEVFAQYKKHILTERRTKMLENRRKILFPKSEKFRFDNLDI